MLQQKSYYGEKEVAKDLRLLDKITWKETQNHFEIDSGAARHVHSGDALQVLKQEQFSFRVSKGQLSMMQQYEEQGVIVGHKKPFSKRKCRLTHQKVESSVVVSQEQQVDMGTISPDLSRLSKSQRGKSSMGSKREPIVQVEVSTKKPQTGSSQELWTGSNDIVRQDLPPNLVSSGEVSLVDKVNSSMDGVQTIQLISKQQRTKPRFNLAIINTGRRMEGIMLSASKVHSSQNSESQLTHISTDLHTWRPRMGSRLTSKHVQGRVYSPEKSRGNVQSPVNWQPNMRTIVEGSLTASFGNSQFAMTQKKLSMDAMHTAKKRTQQLDPETAAQLISSVDHAPFQAQIADPSELHLKQEPLSGKLYCRKRWLQNECTLQFEEAVPSVQNRNSYSGTQRRKGEPQTDSEQTKYLNFQSKMTDKQTPFKPDKVELQLKNSLLNINKDLSQLTETYSEPQSPLKKSTCRENSQLSKEGGGAATNCSMRPKWQRKINGTPIDLTSKSPGQQRLIEGNRAQESQTSQQKRRDTQIEGNSKKPHYMQVSLQSQTKVDEESESKNGETNRIETKMCSQPSSDAQKRRRKDLTTVTHSSPQLLMLENHSTEALPSDNQYYLGDNCSPNVQRMLSQYVQQQRDIADQNQAGSPRLLANMKPTAKQKQEDWRQLQISPIAQNTRNIQQMPKRQTVAIGYQNNHREKEEKQCLGDLLMQECQQLSSQIQNVGVLKESRPGVRFVSRQQIETLQKSCQLQSTRTLQDSARNGQKRALEKIEENPSTQQRTFVSNELMGRSVDDHSSKFNGRTKSNVNSRLSPIFTSQMSQRKTFESIERLKAFRSTAFNKHAVQPYVRSDCKYVMMNTGETLASHMKRFYGMNPPSPSSQRGSKTQRILQDHAYNTSQDRCYQLQKVPLQRKDGHMLSDVASPNESEYAKRKLLCKQRKELALATQSEIRNRQLEMGYNLASPAARMRSLLLTEQKKHNQMGKPTGKGANLLIQDFSGLKTWRMRI